MFYLTDKQLEAEYPNDDACLEAVFQDRFGHVKFCPSCGAETKFYRVKKRQCYACKWCSYQLFPLANSIFRKSTTPLTDWFYAIYLFSTHKNGISAKTLERELGVTYKTAWRMAKQIRLLMKQENDKLNGEVETDETYAPSRPHPRKIGTSKKQTVFGIVERKGKVSAHHVKSSGARVLLPIIKERVERNTVIYSDEYGAYRTLDRLGYSHTTVNHSRQDYVRGRAHTNTIEGFWSQLKRSIDGTYHAVSPKYLQPYVDEFVFRYNHRDEAAGPVLLELALKPVL
jgi:transposase-like protein